MADTDLPGIPLPPPAAPGARCPWCSALLADPDDVACDACGATVKGDAALEIPGVTALDAQHAAQAVTPRKVRRTFGALFTGGDDEILPPAEAELPALAPPDAEVRREILRLQMDAELVKLTARAAALAAEKGIPFPAVPPGAPEPGAAPDEPSPDELSTDEVDPQQASPPDEPAIGETTAAFEAAPTELPAPGPRP
jgi:hypothetical protein